MAFSIQYVSDIPEDFKKIPRNITSRIRSAIEKRLGQDPMSYGKPLRGNLKSIWSLRVGDYRVIYQIRDRIVLVMQVVHRRDAYDEGIIETRERGIL